MQGNLAMRTAIFQRKHPTALAAVENNGIAGEPPGKCLAGFEFVRPGKRIPLIWVSADAAQVDWVRRRQRRQIRAFFGHEGGFYPIRVAWSALISMEAKVGIEPAYTALQAAALPLCHLAHTGSTRY